MKRFFVNLTRSLKRNPLYASINIVGLMIGFICVAFISIWIKSELSYDRYDKNADYIYRVHRYFYDANGTENLHLPYIAPPIAPLLKPEIPEIEHIARLYPTGLIVSYGDHKIVEPDACFAEPEILKIFTFKGLPADSDLLKNPLTAIISEKTAQKYFKSENAIGKALTIFDPQGNSYDLAVSGVFDNWNMNTHFHPDILISFSTYAHVVGESELKDWSSNNYETFALMKYKPQNLDARLDAFINKQFENGTSWNKIRMEKLTDIHFNWYGNRSYVYILSSIALLILLLGSINYMNLNTAIYTRRTREVQVKKIVGASRMRLASQLILESVFFSLLALGAALLFVSVTLPASNRIFNTHINFFFGQNMSVVLGFALLAVLVGIISGLYPAFFTLSSKVSGISNLVNSTPGKTSLRNVLVVFQFFISIALIMSFLAVNKQLNFLRNMDLGFNKDNVITFNVSEGTVGKAKTFRQELMQNPAITDVCFSKRIPSQDLADASEARVLHNGKIEPLGFRVANVRVDENFVPTYEIKLLAGRNISGERTNEAEYLINRSAVEKIGWNSPRDAVGQYIEYGGVKGKVVGVVENFHYESLHNPISPIIMYNDPSDFNRVSVRVHPADLSATITFIGKTWQQFDGTGLPFSYEFINDRLAKLYQSEETVKVIFGIFTTLAISIAVLGLFGLSLFMMERKTKEIGIRKVNGARITEVIAMLNKDFVIWVSIAFAGATPLAWFALNQWLRNFAYKTSLSWWIFALSGVVALAIALLTVSWQSWRAATRNPVESLRYE